MAIVTECMDTGCLRRYWIPRQKLRLARQKIRILGDWPDKFATSNSCAVATDLIEDVDKVAGRVKDMESKPVLNPKQIEVEAVRKLAEWMSTELKPLYLMYAKLSLVLETPGDRFDAIVTRVDALESGKSPHGLAATSTTTMRAHCKICSRQYNRQTTQSSLPSNPNQ
eukprot:scaffold36707_cov61-Attheya_sp.AAC.3